MKKQQIMIVTGLCIICMAVGVATGIFIVDRNLEFERGILKADLFSSGRIAGYVDLTPEQVKAIDEIGLRYRDDLAAYNARMHTSRAEFKNAFFDANTDEEGVVRVFTRNRQTMTELMRLRYRKYREIDAVLTPGQREKIRALVLGVLDRLESRIR